MMPPSLLTKHALPASLDALLDPAALSERLQAPITAVRRAPLVERMGTSRNHFEWVWLTTHGGEERRYALKRIRFNDDWFMQATNDTRCRSVTLWEYGLLDRLTSHIDHTIIACCRDEDGWAILMKDVSAGQYPALDRFTTPQHIYGYLDALAFMHATFWTDDVLTDERLGLNDTVSCIDMSSIDAARALQHVPSIIPAWILDGWEQMQVLLEPDARDIYTALMLNRQPLYDALAKYPVTLLHGDYRSGGNANLAYMADWAVPVCAFDWQHASRAVMTIDMAWFINRITVRSIIAPDVLAAYYRERLEQYLGFRFESMQWQAMLELGLLTDVLRFGVFQAHLLVHQETDEIILKHSHDTIQAFNDQLRSGAHWL